MKYCIGQSITFQETTGDKIKGTIIDIMPNATLTPYRILLENTKIRYAREHQLSINEKY